KSAPQTESTGSLIYARNHLGSVTDTQTPDGRAVTHTEYGPYGELVKSQGRAEYRSDFGYAGMQYHAASGMYLTLFRAYDPSTGRWVSRDPIGEQGGFNLYAYVGGNPVSYIDPAGQTRLDINSAINAAKQMQPSWKFPSAVETWGQEGKAGKHSWWDSTISVDSRYLECLDDGDASALLGTVLHELAHLNQTWYQFAFDNTQERLTGGARSNAQDTADSLMWNHSNIVADYLKNRGNGEKSCGCRK
ncbi:RHS repeat-associated core domain-containing protein, partial [Ralstonia solanacearum]